jgi:diguanylate cyclase (GGDEF)-like protein
MHLFIVVLALGVVPMLTIILLYEHELVRAGNNGLILIPLFMLLSAKSITALLEYLLFKNNLLKIHKFSERIKDGYYETHFSLPMQQDEENYLIQVLRSLESLARVIRGQNNMLLYNLQETRTEANMMKQLAERDALTGLFNRRYFDTVFKAEAESSRRNRIPLTLIMVDCDKFKQVNDTYGHDTGDRVLKQLAFIMTEVIRNGRDIPFRFGGDEFGILLPQTELASAERVVGRLLEVYMTSERHGTTLSVSAVSAVLPESGNLSEHMKKIIKKADDGIYQVKRKGGDGAVFTKI